MNTEKHNAVSIDPQGYFQRAGKRVLPIGVNYWPASCGVEMWQHWDAEEIKRDLDIVRGLGLNCVRFFLRWPDFEPTFGNYDERMFDRLADFVSWCGERGILAHPCLVTGFMSGGHFWPADKNGRNLYADPVVRAASAAYCAKAAAKLRPFASTILGLDLGNELDCADAWAATPAQISEWCATVTSAIRAEWPDVLIVSGLDSGPIMRDCPWHLDGQPGTDFLSIHNYPVPDWNVVDFDGMTDPFCQAILPFNALVARTYGPVMLQEFSTILMQGVPECESYYSAVVDGCLANGANGFLWWCLRDIPAPIHPYEKSAFEGRLGLVGDDGKVKPSLVKLVARFREIAGNCESLAPAEAGDDAVGLYWPKEIYGSQTNPGNSLEQVYRRLLAAYYMLGLIGRHAVIVRGDRSIPQSVKTLIVAGAALTVAETKALEAYVAAGGRLLWSGASWNSWSKACDAMSGATPVDIKRPRDVQVNLFGRDWQICASPVTYTRVVARATTATVVASDADGKPIVLSHDHGAGRCVTITASPEESVARLGGEPEKRDVWREWFKGVLELVEG